MKFLVILLLFVIHAGASLSLAQERQKTCTQVFAQVGQLHSLHLRPYQEALSNSGIALIARGIEEATLPEKDHLKLGFFSPFFEEHLPVLLNWALPNGSRHDEVHVLFRPLPDFHKMVTLSLVENGERRVEARIRDVLDLKDEIQSHLMFSQWVLAHSAIGPAAVYQPQWPLEFGSQQVSKIFIRPETQMMFDFGTMDGEFFSHDEVEILLNQIHYVEEFKDKLWLAKVYRNGAIYRLYFDETITDDGAHVYNLVTIKVGEFSPLE